MEIANFIPPSFKMLFEKLKLYFYSISCVLLYILNSEAIVKSDLTIRKNE